MTSAAQTAIQGNLQLPVGSAFDFQPRTRVVYGAGSFSQLGEIVAEFGATKILLVTDPGLRAAGHSETAVASLKQVGLKVSVFDDVAPNPTTDDVDRCVSFAKEHNVQLIVGLGGGSSMDLSLIHI